MPIPTRQYDAVYRGESQEAQSHPALIKGRAYVVYVSQRRGQVTVEVVSRVDVEYDQVAVQRHLGIPPHLYRQAEELANDWALAEWPFDWLALQYDFPAPTSLG